MKILIADTRSNIRNKVENVLVTLPAEAQVEETYYGEEALSKIESGNYDLVILENNADGLNGLDILEKTQTPKTKTRILIYTEQPEVFSAKRAFQSGASGYLTRFSAHNVLNIALHDITLGDGYEVHAS